MGVEGFGKQRDSVEWLDYGEGLVAVVEEDTGIVEGVGEDLAFVWLGRFFV